MSKEKTTFGQAMQALNLIQSKNKTLEELEHFFQSGLLSDILDADLPQIDRNDFREHIGLPRAGFKFWVDYNFNLEDLISRNGIKRFDKRITRQNIPFVKIFEKSRVEIKAEIHTFVRKGIIVGLNRSAGNSGRRYCLQKLTERGVRGATLEELICFNRQFPKESIDRKIFAPGSPTNIESGATWYNDELDGVYKSMAYIKDGESLELDDEAAWCNYHILAIRES